MKNDCANTKIENLIDIVAKFGSLALQGDQEHWKTTKFAF
jgi:hypothetical protein